MVAPYITSTDLADWCAATSVPSNVLADLIQRATDILFVASGSSETGLVTRSVRPVRSRGCYGGAPHGFFGWPSLDLRNQGWGPLDDRRIPLGFSTVTSVSVKIDGAAFTGWKLYDDNWLVRTDGLNWPGSQDPYLDDTLPGTFAVNFTQGAVTRPLMKAASIELVKELYHQDQLRKIPANVTSASAQGIGLAFDRQLDRDSSLPGVQALIQTLNPEGDSIPPQWSDWDAPWVLHSQPV